MNAEGVGLGVQTRFFHHDKVRSRWWSKFGPSYAMGPPEEAELSQASDAPPNFTPPQHILARVGVDALNGSRC